MSFFLGGYLHPAVVFPGVFCINYFSETPFKLRAHVRGAYPVADLLQMVNKYFGHVFPPQQYFLAVTMASFILLWINAVQLTRQLFFE